MSSSELARQRAEAVLRDRLTPAQNADVDATDWFNVRDALGKLWRVRAATQFQNFAGCNLIDRGGVERTMYAVDELGCYLPPCDIALGLLLYFGDPELSAFVHQDACKWNTVDKPDRRELKAHYRSFGERIGGGKIRHRRTRR